MENFDPIAWAKVNKKKFAQDFVEKSHLTDDDKYSAFIMAGLPGSGKTETTKGLLRHFELNMVRIDMDEIASQIPTYQPENADQFRKSATLLMDNIFDLVLENRFNFILDGTFGSPRAINNIERALKRGYSVKIIYVYQDPKTAWEYTLAREKVEHRAIKFDGFLNSYFKIHHNLHGLPKHPRISLDFIGKNPQNEVTKWKQNATITTIDKYVNHYYNKEELESYIKG